MTSLLRKPQNKRYIALILAQTVVFALLCYNVQILFASPQVYSSVESSSPLLRHMKRQHQAKMEDLHHTVANPLQSTMDHYIQTYRDVVSDHYYKQTKSWQMHFAGLHKDQRSESDIKDDRRKLMHSSSPELDAIRDEMKVLHRQPRPKHTFWADYGESDEEKLLADTDDDIPGYFDHLNTACGPQALKRQDSTSFSKGCFGYLDELARLPRCTTRLDSRFKCTGDTTQSKPVRSAQQVIQEEMMDDGSINVVILGGGPVGLYMANQLMNNLATTNVTQTPVKVLVFESRIHEVGHKKPYSRNYISDLWQEFFEELDPMLYKFLKGIHQPMFVRTPIYELETLLLLSCRRLGVQFLYDDPRHYKHDLLQIPNLIVADATGHRLQPLDRPKPKDASEFSEIKWKEPGLTRYFNQAQHEFLHKTHSLVHITEQVTSAGTITFPVTSTGTPYVLQMIKINDVHTTDPEWKDLRQLVASFRSTAHPICQAGRPFSPCHMNRNPDECNAMCGHFYLWDSAGQFRDDIRDSMYKHFPEEVIITVGFGSLTGPQSDALYALMPDTHRRYTLADFPWKDIGQQLPAYQETDMETLFTTLEDTPVDRRAGIDLFSFRPFIYEDPVWPKASSFLGPEVPVIRIGDSLASGDPNLSTGLGFHIRVVDNFVRRLMRGIKGESTEDLIQMARTERTS